MTKRALTLTKENKEERKKKMIIKYFIIYIFFKTVENFSLYELNKAIVQKTVQLVPTSSVSQENTLPPPPIGETSLPSLDIPPPPNFEAPSLDIPSPSDEGTIYIIICIHLFHLGFSPPPPPPPPPLPGAPPLPGKLGSIRTKQHPKTNVKLKGFYWSRVPNVSVPHYWEEGIEDEKITLSTNTLESLFIAEPPKEDASEQAIAPVEHKPTVVTLIDVRRSNNICRNFFFV